MAPSASAEAQRPADVVELGRIVGAWGVKGWIRVQPFSDPPEALLAARHWLLQAPERRARSGLPPSLTIAEARRHGALVVASALEVAGRDAAEALRGAQVLVPRAGLPATAADEFYWHDLIGLAVVNREGVALGAVAGLLDTGAHSVLRVAPSKAQASEHLIPFVAAYVDAVDLSAQRIDVDWQPDY